MDVCVDIPDEEVELMKVNGEYVYRVRAEVIADLLDAKRREQNDLRRSSRDT